MRRRDFLAGGAMILPMIGPALAQQRTTTQRLALVNPSMSVANMRIGGDSAYHVLLEELRRLGFVEGTNLTIDRYSGEGQVARYGELARQVVAAHPDVIAVTGSPLTSQFKAATSTIPVVALTGDPVRFKLVESIARPGGNITGVSVDAGLEVWGKRLELLVQAMGKPDKVAFFSSQGVWDNPGGKLVREVAQKLGITLVHAPIGRQKDEAEYRRALDAIEPDRVDGLLISDEGELYTDRLLLVRLIGDRRIPTIFVYRDQAEAGGLMAYSYDLAGAVRKNATQVAEILRGARPADMPYVQEARFELVINLKTAKVLGLDIPAQLVARADVVIE